jgi:hypothetical protein
MPSETWECGKINGRGYGSLNIEGYILTKRMMFLMDRAA